MCSVSVDNVIVEVTNSMDIQNCFGHETTLEDKTENDNYNNENTISFIQKKKYRNNQSIVTIEPKYANVITVKRNGLIWNTEQKVGPLTCKLSNKGNLTAECKQNKIKIIQKNHENKDFLCSRCGKKMQEPRLLPCLHAMCSPCIFDLIGKVNNLNTTNIHTTIPPPHYPLQHRLVMDAMHRKLVHKILCDACSDEVLAIVQCCVCLRNFCSDCGNEHEAKTSREVKQGKHLIKPLWEATRVRRTILCHIHTLNALRYYCNACQQVCCKECIWSIEHRGHASENAIGAGRRATAYVTAMLEKAKILLNSLLTHYNEDVFSNDNFNEQKNIIDQWHSTQ
ncbi:hypothetical protein KPH14_009993 [Odynerus spinipes]|uniref:B box-type domain-containing protein n=1 Tax=Odynerus spinipes TaxID=1348599 RepID=A0AAD9RST9_9HYME|nr:hypothetical protein KPH14_009993 [Odynerus spinipes]